MLKYISASWLYPVSSAPIAHGVLELGEGGTIKAVFSPEQAKSRGIENIEKHQGILVPGFVNTHCHLELSHLLGKIQEGTGLQEFVRQVIGQRTMAEELILEAITKADQDMHRQGIVAVGDISNQLISRQTKQQSDLYYHTFIETLGFNPQQAPAVMGQAIGLKQAFAPLKASIVPHAPYSVSKELFALIRAYSQKEENLISMHNQETADENEFFEHKKGAFLKLYEFLGLDISFFQASGQSALKSILPELPMGKVLMVHNTFTAASDVHFALKFNPDIYWCLCPNANQYIENRLPDVAMLRHAGAKFTLGTDSLASNHQLSVLAEMQTLIRAGQTTFEESLRWATLNGAEFLGISQQYGSLEAGKRPGINLLQFEGDQPQNKAIIKRLI